MEEGAAQNEKVKQELHIVGAGVTNKTSSMSSTIEQGGAGTAGKRKKHTTATAEKEGSIIRPRDLKIVWGSDETQWKIEHPNEDYAEAIKVMWFEVKATYKSAKPGNTYRIGFNVSLKSEAFGWDSSPVFLMAKVGESGSYTWKRLYLNIKEVEKRFDFPDSFEIAIPITTEDTTLQFGLYEIWAGRWKGGLRIHHAYVTKV